MFPGGQNPFNFQTPSQQQGFAQQQAQVAGQQQAQGIPGMPMNMDPGKMQGLLHQAPQLLQRLQDPQVRAQLAQRLAQFGPPPGMPQGPMPGAPAQMGQGNPFAFGAPGGGGAGSPFVPPPAPAMGKPTGLDLLQDRYNRFLGN